MTIEKQTPSPHASRSSEPVVTINGYRLTEGQATTLRVAIQSFDAFSGDDAFGKELSAAYEARTREIISLILAPPASPENQMTDDPVAWMTPDGADVATDRELDYRGPEHSAKVRAIYSQPLYLRPSPQTNVTLTEDQVAAVLNVVETRLCIIWPRIGAREEFANLLRVMEPVSDDDGDEDACIVCGERLEDGDDVYWSSNDDGHMHAECATSYVDDDGNETDEAPKPFAFRTSRSATTEGQDDG